VSRARLDAIPPAPLRARVGVWLCRRHARIPRAQYEGTGGVALTRLRS
jgi:hypothetical protein